MKATLKMRDIHFSTSQQTSTRQGKQEGDQGNVREELELKETRGP